MSSSSIGGESVSTAGLDAAVGAAAAAARSASPAIHVNFATMPPNSATGDAQSVFSSSQVSKGNSLAFDVNSMSAACSRDNRPRKRQKLENVLQDFSFQGVPDQILPPGLKRTLTGDSSIHMAPPGAMQDVNSYKRARHQADGDIDDNSQLTASDVEDGSSFHTGGMPGDLDMIQNGKLMLGGK